MYLFPTYERVRLGVGEVEQIRLKGTAGPNPAGGDTRVNFELLGTADLDWLLATDDARTFTTARILTVSG
jgi:hypothetical protein